jgi:hypothetical protein
MIPVDYELARQVHDERQFEAAADRLARCAAGAQYSRATLWLILPAARELLERIRDFVGVAANRAESPWQSGARQ